MRNHWARTITEKDGRTYSWRFPTIWPMCPCCSYCRPVADWVPGWNAGRRPMPCRPNSSWRRRNWQTGIEPLCAAGPTRPVRPSLVAGTCRTGLVWYPRFVAAAAGNGGAAVGQDGEPTRTSRNGRQVRRLPTSWRRSRRMKGLQPAMMAMNQPVRECRPKCCYSAQQRLMKRPSNSVSTAGNYLRKSCRPRPSRSECRDATDTSDVKQQFAKLVFSIYQNL